VYRINGHSLWSKSERLWPALRAVDDVYGFDRMCSYPVHHDERKRAVAIPAGLSRGPVCRDAERSRVRCATAESSFRIYATMAARSSAASDDQRTSILRMEHPLDPVSAGLTANPHAWHWSSARLAGESACPTMGASSAGLAGESAAHNGREPSRNVGGPSYISSRWGFSLCDRSRAYRGEPCAAPS